MRLRQSAVIITLLLLVTNSVSAFFTDTATSPYKEFIEKLEEREVVRGYADGTFRPNARINRAEFLKILMDAKYPGRTPVDLRCFADLDVQTPQWYARTTCAAQELGIVGGYPDGTFKPERNVQLDEALKMSFLTFGIVPSSTGGAWYEPYLREARSRGILISLLSEPTHLVTRGEMALIASTLLDNEEENPAPTEPGVCGNGVKESTEQCDDGNVQDSDGCSSICILVPEPIRRAILQIDQQTTGTLSTVARGQQNVNLLKFTAVSGRQDSKLTTLIFEPSVGSLTFAQHYELMMDRDGDGSYETVAQAEGKVEAGRLIFESMVGGGVELPVGLIVPFLVRADLVSTLGPVSLGLQFMTSLPDYVEAQGVDDGLALEGIETNGVCSRNCFIRVNTMGATNINVSDKGNLYVTEDSVSVRSHILLNSTTSDTLLRLKFRGEGEPIDVRTLRFDGVVSSVESLLLYKLSPGQALTSSMTPFATASNGQCPDQTATRFCASLPNGTFILQPDTETVIAVAARMKSDQLGGISGQTMTLTVSNSTTPGATAVEANGQSSSQTLSQNDGNGNASGEIFIGRGSPGINTAITGKINDTAFASIRTVTNDGLTEESSVPTGFVSFAAFKIWTLPHSNTMFGSDDVVIRTLTFHVNAQNVQIDPLSIKLSTKENPEAQLSCTAGASTGSFDVICSGIQNGPIQSRISQGNSLVYKLYGNITNSQINPGTSTLVVSLPTLGQRTVTNSIEWSDQTTVFTWVDMPDTSVNSTIYRR